MRKHGLFLFGAKNTASFMEVRGLTLKGEITMMKAIKNFMNKPITYGLISNTAPYVQALAWHCADGRIIR